MILNDPNIVEVSQKELDSIWKQIDDAYAEIKKMIREKEKVIALIKDGRFVEALQLLDGK